MHVCESGFTRQQEIIGNWAIRDGSWSETPQKDFLGKGMKHDSRMDGSEAEVFYDKQERTMNKLVYFTHYPDIEKFIDRISIHNASFPETPIHLHGFALADGREDNEGFVAVVSQPFVEGEAPTINQITEHMSLRSCDRTDNDLYYVSHYENFVISDLGPNNCVISPKGNLLVFDCDAELKTRPIHGELKEFTFQDLADPDSPAWEIILKGVDGKKECDVIRQNILFRLRTNGEYVSPLSFKVDGKEIALKDIRAVCKSDEPTLETTIGGVKRKFFDGTVTIGNRLAFDEKIYEIPTIRFDQKAVEAVVRNATHLAPMTMPMDSFLYSEEFAGPKASQVRGGAPERDYLKEQLLQTGRIEGLCNGKYHVCMDPEHKGNVLVNEKENVEFMLWANNSDVEWTGRLTAEEKRTLSKGETIFKAGRALCFDIDKGRVALVNPSQLKLYKRIKEKHDERLRKERQKARSKAFGL